MPPLPRSLHLSYTSRLFLILIECYLTVCFFFLFYLSVLFCLRQAYLCSSGWLELEIILTKKYSTCHSEMTSKTTTSEAKRQTTPKIKLLSQISSITKCPALQSLATEAPETLIELWPSITELETQRTETCQELTALSVRNLMKKDLVSSITQK